MKDERHDQDRDKDEHIHTNDDADRRGEHKYPPNAQDEAERPSQRDRDHLKSRLERRS